MRRHLACRCKYCHSKKQCCCQLACPNKCGEDVLQDEIHEHRKLCPFEMVECKHQCGARLTRCEIEKHHKTCERQLVQDFQLMYSENLQNIYEEIESNANIISEATDTVKDETDTLKQSVADIEQITINYYERDENILGCNSIILLLILVLLISLTVMMTQMQVKLETISINNNKLSKQIDHKMNKVENSWLLKYDEQKHNDYLPVIMKMTDFTEKRKHKRSWYSDPFFVSKDGCQMCLLVDASGRTDQKDTFISVYLYVEDLHNVTVEHYSQCKWPVSREFSVELLNHYTNSSHHCQKLTVVSNPGSRRFDFVDTNLIFSGLGCYNFISHKILSESGHIYSGNDTLYFRILYEEKPTNTVHKHRFVDIFLNYCIKIIAAHLFFQC